MKVAEYIVKRLEEFGINDIFGVNEYFSDIKLSVENNSNVNWINCTNYQNAGYAADGYARIRGFGAVVTMYDTGELSLINSIASSMADNVPVIYISEVPDSISVDDYNNHIKLFADYTASLAILNLDNAKYEIDRVLKAFFKERKPVYVLLTSEIANYDITDHDAIYDWVSDEDALSAAVAKISEKINSSVLPVIVGGSLIKRFNADIEFKEFVEKSGFPIANTKSGINIINTNYPVYIGNIINCDDNSAFKYLKDSDCLISIGCNDLPVGVNPNIAIYGTYTYIDGEIFNNIKMTDILESITKITETRDIKTEKFTLGYEKKSPEVKPLTTEYIYQRIQDFIKENDIIVVENGAVSNCVNSIKLPENVKIEHQIIRPLPGWATSATLGVCIAKPTSRVILISDAGAHISSPMEVGTMLKCGLKPVILILNNNFGNNIDGNKDNCNLKISFSKFARIFEGDVWPIKACSEDDFDKALKVTQIMNKMCYIEMYTDTDDILPIQQFINKHTDENVQFKSLNNGINQEPVKPVKSVQLSCNFQYETTVHQNIVVNDNNELFIQDKSKGDNNG